MPICCNPLVLQIRVHQGKELSIKDIRNQGERGCPVRTFCGQGGGVALFGAKNI